MSKKQSENRYYNTKKNNKSLLKRQSPLNKIRQDVAGIDLGSTSHFVALLNPNDKGTVFVKEFGTFTSNLCECINWLKQNKVKSVVMEATGVYWMHFYSMLDERGFEVILANSRHVKHVKGRKTDVSDAEWLMQLHSYGLLEGAFIPNGIVRELRTFLRLREQYIRSSGQAIQRMQKALISMNLRLDNVLNDISGKTGLAVIRAILNGERDSRVLATYRDGRCKCSEEDIEESLKGHYRVDQLFALKSNLEDHEYNTKKVRDCDKKIEVQLQKFQTKSSEISLGDTKKSQEIKERKKTNKRIPKLHEFDFNLRRELFRITGVDLIALPGIGESTALTLISEIGLDMSKWPTAKHFCSWLKLSPNNQISGGKVLRSSSGKNGNRAAGSLRLAVNGLWRESNDTALGLFLRRKKGQKGAPKAITAASNKLAKMVYNTLKSGNQFIEPGASVYQEMRKDQAIRGMRSTLQRWGYGIHLIGKKTKE